jgi:hypothetical protein
MKRVQLATEELLSNIKSDHNLKPSPITPLSQSGGNSPILGESYSRSLDDAATVLINILSPSIRDYAIELADITLKIPRWQLLLGSMVAQYESGSLTAPTIDPSWRQAEAAMSDSICQLDTCGKHFIPKRFGQRFCSQECGDTQRKREIDEINKRRRLEEVLRRRRERDEGFKEPEFPEEEL